MVTDKIPDDSDSPANRIPDSVDQELLAANGEQARAAIDITQSHPPTAGVNDLSALLLESTAVIVVALDDAGRVLMLNRGARVLLGDNRDELVGRDWLELAIPQERRRELSTLFMNVRTGNAELPSQNTYLIQTRTGGLRSIEWRNTAMLHEGRFAGYLAIGVDVTDRAEAVAALSDSEIRYRRLFESAKDGILILDAQTGTVVDVNPFLTELLGLTYSELVGRKVWELGFLRDVAASQENFLELQRHEYIRYEDLPLETADGQQIDAEFVSNVYRVNDDLVIQCNIRNITARKHAETKLRDFQSGLETLIQERTAELAKANEKLQHETIARIRAEEAQLAAVVEERTRIGREIHDTLAQGFTGIVIQLEAADDVLAENPQSAQNHMERARQLARDSLAEARRSMWALRPQMLEKGDLAFAIGTLVENLASQSPLSIEFEHQGEPSRFARDVEEGILRICQEALMNAGKHANAQVIRVVLVFGRRQLELRVEDDGQGFDILDLPFLRGLGVRIMKERASNMNGTCSISSTPGQGTSVLVRIPVNGDRTGDANA